MTDKQDFQDWLRSAVPSANGDPPVDPERADVLEQIRARKQQQERQAAAASIVQTIRDLVRTGFSQHLRLNRLADAYAERCARIVELRAQHLADVEQLELKHADDLADCLDQWNQNRARYDELPLQRFYGVDGAFYGRLEFNADLSGITAIPVLGDPIRMEFEGGPITNGEPGPGWPPDDPGTDMRPNRHRARTPVERAGDHEIFTTSSGQRLTRSDIERLAEEAERGYDPANMRPRSPVAHERGPVGASGSEARWLGNRDATEASPADVCRACTHERGRHYAPNQHGACADCFSCKGFISSEPRATAPTKSARQNGGDGPVPGAT